MLVIVLLLLWFPLAVNAQGVPVEVAAPIVHDSAAATAPSALVESQAQAAPAPRLDMTQGQGEISWLADRERLVVTVERTIYRVHSHCQHR